MPETIAIAELSLDPANARRHGPKNIDAVVASLRRFGQQTPIVIDENNVIRKGNGTVEAAKKLGWADIEFVRTDLTGSEATAYAIADNRTSELADWDDEMLHAQLAALANEDIDLIAAAGFDASDIAAMLANLDPGSIVDDPDGEWVDMPEFHNEDKTSFQSIHLHFKDQATVDEFAKLIDQTISDKTRSLWYPKAEIGHTADKRYEGTPE